MKAAWKEKAIKLMLFAMASTSILIVIGILYPTEFSLFHNMHIQCILDPKT